jgi:hypothetical protein
MKLPFDFRAWQFLVNGVALGEFAAGDDAFEVDRNEDSFDYAVGVTGEMSAYLNANRSGMVTVKLAANSASNTYLGTLMNLQEGGYKTFVPIVFAAKDQALQDVVDGLKGVIVRPSKMTRGQKPGDQEWKFLLERVDFFFGGALNAPLL